MLGNNVSGETKQRESFLDSLIFIMLMLYTKAVNKRTLLKIMLNH